MAIRVSQTDASSGLSSSKLSEYVVNPYLGCEHGCRYCYAQRYFHSRSAIQQPWGKEIIVRRNIHEMVCREARIRRKGRVLLSSMTDCYQPSEAKYGLTRKVLECLVKEDFPLAVLTKSPLVLRDLDLLAHSSDVEITFSISSLDPEVFGAFEPKAPTPEARIDALRRILDSGFKGGLFIAPHLPAKGSFDTQYSPIFQAARDLGLRTVLMDTLNHAGLLRREIMRTYTQDYQAGMDAFKQMLASPSLYNEQLRKKTKSLGESFGIGVMFA